jgi:hypothetical protein
MVDFGTLPALYAPGHRPRGTGSVGTVAAVAA